MCENKIMTKQTGYEYSSHNLLETPQKYKMTPFQGSQFLEQYKESRRLAIELIRDKVSTITLDQATTQMQQDFKHPLEIINASKFSTKKLFESIFLIVIRDKDDVNVTNIINRFVKKFEVKKRIFSFYNQETTYEEKWLGMSTYNPGDELFLKNENNENVKVEFEQKKYSPDIYYIIPDEYPSNYALKQFFSFDNNKFLEFLDEQEFHIVKNSFSNYPSTIQSLTSSLNMEYLDKITKEVDRDSKNYRLLNKLLSDNEVMKKFSSYGYDIVNIGALWGPNGSFKNVKTNLCEFKEVNRDSLSRQLIEKSIIMHFYEKHFEQLRRDQIICTYNEIENTSEERTTPKFVFVHILSPHAPYIFGPNGENVSPGNSLDSSPWNERNAHVDQIKFVNKNLIELIPKLLNSENKPIIILQGDTGAGYEIDWKSPSDVMVIERMSNLNAIYFPNKNYDKINNLTPVNTFRIIFNEYFDEENVLHENKNYWSNSEKPYTFVDITKQLKNNQLGFNN